MFPITLQVRIDFLKSIHLPGDYCRDVVRIRFTVLVLMETFQTEMLWHIQRQSFVTFLLFLNTKIATL